MSSTGFSSSEGLPTLSTPPSSAAFSKSTIEKPEGHSLARRATIISKASDTYSLLSCLSTAQYRNIDFIGITWQEALGLVGKGGEGEISQSAFSIEDIFVFKRNVNAERKQASEIFRELNSEISVLGHPKIRDHPNIILLEGICWEIEKGWFASEKVWPVLILEKASHGDLERFMRSDKGRGLSLEGRMQICAEIGSAVKTMHANNIIHGDIKPNNVLIFDDGNDGFTPKLTDFGYSTMYSGESEVRVPQSKPWDAPERQHRKSTFSHTDAEKIDVYCFGVLCLWVLFREHLEAKGKTIPETWVGTLSTAYYAVIGVPKEEQERRKLKPDIASLYQLRKDGSTQEYALDLADTVSSLSPKQKSNLKALFKTTLAREVEDRHLDFKEIISLLGNERHLESPEVPDIQIELREDFSVARDVQSLCQADYRVREEIILGLQRQYEDPQSSQKQKRNAAFQLAFCTKIGLGTPKDEAKSDDWLEKSGYLRDMNHEIESARVETQIHNPRVRRMYDKGILKPIDHALEFRKGGDLDAFEKRCVREISEMEEILGKTHSAILNLKSTLMNIYRDQGSPRLLSILEELVEDLRNDPSRGPKDEYYVMYMSDLGTTLIAQGKLDEGEQALQESYENIKQICGTDNIKTLLVAMNLAMCYQTQGRAKAAHEVGQTALQGFQTTLGDAHHLTLGVKSLYEGRLEQEGKLDFAEDEKKGLLKNHIKTSGSNDPTTINAAIELIRLLLFAGKFDEAEKQNYEFQKQLDRNHPARGLLDGPVLADIWLHQERYAEAGKKYQDIQKILSGLPWPPPQVPMSNRGPRGPAPEPKDFPNNPELLIYSMKYAIAIQAEAQREEKAGNKLQSSKLYETAQKALSLVMGDMGKTFGGDLWGDVNTEPGIMGSALNTAMMKEYTYPLEILVSIGGLTARDGIHYEEAIKVAANQKLPNVVAILEEHQLLCGKIPNGPSFHSCDQLHSFIEGNWEGSYLYIQGGYRKDKTGRVRFTLFGSDDASNPGAVSIEGHGRDDRGELEYKGKASVDGRFTIWLSLKGEGVDMAWEYSGYLNLERRAMGGRWGIRNAVLPIGTSFFYKV